MQTSNHPGQQKQNPSNQARKLLDYFHSRPGLCKRQKPFIMQKHLGLQTQVNKSTKPNGIMKQSRTLNQLEAIARDATTRVSSNQEEALFYQTIPGPPH